MPAPGNGPKIALKGLYSVYSLTKMFKREFGRRHDSGILPALWRYFKVLLPSLSMLQRQQPPAVECNASHAPTHGHTRPRFAARCIDLPWSPPRTGPRGGYAAAVLATYDTPRLSAAAAAVYLGSWLTAINAQLTRFAPRGSVMGVCCANRAMPHTDPRWPRPDGGIACMKNTSQVRA